MNQDLPQKCRHQGVQYDTILRNEHEIPDIHITILFINMEDSSSQRTLKKNDGQKLSKGNLLEDVGNGATLKRTPKGSPKMDSLTVTKDADSTATLRRPRAPSTPPALKQQVRL
jgi:hypothetical protein